MALEAGAGMDFLPVVTTLAKMRSIGNTIGGDVVSAL